MWRKLLNFVVTKVKPLELLQVCQALRKVFDQVLTQLEGGQILQQPKVLWQDGQGHVIEAEDDQVLEEDETGGKLRDGVGAEVCNLEGGQPFHVLRNVRDVVPRDIELDKVGEVLDLWREPLDLIVTQAKLPQVVQLEEARRQVPEVVFAQYPALNLYVETKPEVICIEEKFFEASGISHNVFGHIVQRTVAFVHVFNLPENMYQRQAHFLQSLCLFPQAFAF